MYQFRSSRTPLIPLHIPDDFAERKAKIQFEINHLFGHFVTEYPYYQFLILLFFQALIISIEVSKDLLPSCFTGLAIFYLVCLIKACWHAHSSVDRVQAAYKIFEFALAMALISRFNKQNNKRYLIICCEFLLVSFLIKSLLSFLINSSTVAKFMNQVNCAILLIRACMFTQGALLLIHFSLGSLVPFYIILIPILIIAGIIIMFSVKLFENIFIIYRSRFWDSASVEEIKGISWLFGNLFALVFILVGSFISFAGFESKTSESFLELFLFIVIWCAVSLISLRASQNGLKAIYETFVMIQETTEEVDVIQMPKYVIKISSTYYRPATDQEAQQTTNNRSVKLLKDIEMETTWENKDREGAKCIICCWETPDAVFMQCGHGGICFGCAQEVQRRKKCHMCRRRIRGLLKVNIKDDDKGNLYEVASLPSVDLSEI